MYENTNELKIVGFVFLLFTCYLLKDLRTVVWIEFICQNEIPAQFVNHGKTRINQINKSWYEVTFYDTSESSIIIDLPINN